ncbi:AAA family ATPase [Marinobacter sp.]|uniref:AAA family ATPase n=1 Tax=Marinobacter sp. TaxID=50741 RepID=UPI00384F400D
MKLRHIRIEQMKQFRQPLELRDLAPGLNLIHGPNESGKSTLVAAIRAAFFERHRSRSVEYLRPWGDSAAAPFVELEFRCQGRDWHLTKSFLQRKRCDLVVDSESWSGDEAEEKLAELLGYQMPAKGASQAKIQGIPGLLWIEQGTGQDVEQAVSHAGNHLKSALSSLLGEVASTGGDDIINAVRDQRGELLTATGRPRGEYSELAQLQATLEQEARELQERINTYQSQVDRLGELRQKHRKDESERPWETARQHYHEAEKRFREIEQLRQQQAREQQELDHWQQNLKLLRQQKQQAEEQAGKLARREKEFRKAQQAMSELKARTAGLNQSREQADAGYRSATASVEQAKLRDQREGLVREIDRLTRQQQSLDERLTNGRKYQTELAAAREKEQDKAIDPAALAKLKEARRQLDLETLRSQAVATRVSYELEKGRSLEIGGKAIHGSGDRLLLDETTLVMPGLGRLQITPGGEDLGKLKRRLERVQDEHARELKALNVTSLEEAERRAAVQAESRASVRRLEELLGSVAPRGLDALAAEHEAHQQQLSRNLQDLEKLPEPDGEVLSLASAEAAREAAEQRLNAAESAHREHEKLLLQAAHAETSAEREWQQLKEELEGPEQLAARRELQQKIVEAGEKEERIKAVVASRQSQIDQARPDLLEQDMKRFLASAEQLERAHHQRAIEIEGLQGKLESLGAEGLEEQHNELTARLEHTQRRFAELDRRARALDLLLALLQEKRQALTRRLQAPLQRHLNHYLGVLFPQAELDVDDRLIPGQFRRSGEQGQMNELSFGAREQMGLISRLAYADLLQEAGRPTLIILDDTLVHSDQQRLAQMKRILFDAARRHQILLLTCHPDNWQDLGVAPRDLQALKTG